jgi:hypothetical protein
MRAVRMRVRTLIGGIALGGALLLVLAMMGGGVGDQPAERDRSAPDRRGPLTALQPELQRALLTDDDLPGGSPAGSTPRKQAALGEGTGARPADPAPEATALTDLCRVLFEDPSALGALWDEDRVLDDGEAEVRQSLTVFEEERAPEAYQRLREAAPRCQRFQASLDDGSAVEVLLREMIGYADRSESGTVDDSYAMTITVQRAEGELTGWLALDRVGPVISVLRQLGPSSGGVDELARVRQAALDKLAPLLETLRSNCGTMEACLGSESRWHR